MTRRERFTINSARFSFSLLFYLCWCRCCCCVSIGSSSVFSTTELLSFFAFLGRNKGRTAGRNRWCFSFDENDVWWWEVWRYIWRPPYVCAFGLCYYDVLFCFEVLCPNVLPFLFTVFVRIAFCSPFVIPHSNAIFVIYICRRVISLMCKKKQIGEPANRCLPTRCWLNWSHLFVYVFALVLLLFSLFLTLLIECLSLLNIQNPARVGWSWYWLQELDFHGHSRESRVSWWCCPSSSCWLCICQWG